MRARSVLVIALLSALAGTPGVAKAWSSGMISESVSIGQFSTHNKIIAAAYQRLRMAQPAIAEKMPPVEAVLRYEGANGPDGAWAKGQDEDSHHYCNPDLPSEEDAAAYVGRLSGELHHAIESGQDPSTVARLLAAIAHYTADAMSPPHNFGRQRSLSKSVKDNWNDPNWDGHGYLDSLHFLFEADEVVIPFRVPLALTIIISLVTLILLYRRTSKNQKRKRLIWISAILVIPLCAAAVTAILLAGQNAVLHKSGDLALVRPNQAEQAVRTGAKMTLNTGVWQEFTRKGWSPQVDTAVRDVILPEAVERIAEIWAGAVEN